MIAVAEAAQARDTSFEDFFRAEYPLIYRAAMLVTRSPDAAQEIAQEAFARAFARWRRLRRQPWAGGWVMTTAMNLSKRYQRVGGTTTPHQGSTPGPSPSRVDLSGALQKLPIRQRTAIMLFYLRDLPVPQIAEVMQISEGTVKAHLAQARSALRTMLEVTDG